MDEAWKMMQYTASAEGFDLMSKDMFVTMVKNIKGFDVVGRAPTHVDDVWMQQTNLLQNTYITFRFNLIFIHHSFFYTQGHYSDRYY